LATGCGLRFFQKSTKELVAISIEAVILRGTSGAICVRVVSAPGTFCTLDRVSVDSESPPPAGALTAMPRFPGVSTPLGTAPGRPETPDEWLFCSFVDSCEVTVTGLGSNFVVVEL